MAKLKGKKKAAFLRRMAKGRAAAKREGGKRKAGKKSRKGGKRKTGKRKLTAAQIKAACGPRKGKKSASKRKGGKKSSKRKGGKRKSTRRCAPCDRSNAVMLRKRMGKHAVKNVTCSIVKIGNSCRRICFSTVGKSHTKSGALNLKAKRYLLSNQPAKGCGSKKKSIPDVVLRGIVGL